MRYKGEFLCFGDIVGDIDHFRGDVYTGKKLKDLGLEDEGLEDGLYYRYLYKDTGNYSVTLIGDQEQLFEYLQRTGEFSYMPGYHFTSVAMALSEDDRNMLRAISRDLVRFDSAMDEAQAHGLRFPTLESGYDLVGVYIDGRWYHFDPEADQSPIFEELSEEDGSLEVVQQD